MPEGDFIEVMKEAIAAIAPGLENFGARSEQRCPGSERKGRLS